MPLIGLEDRIRITFPVLQSRVPIVTHYCGDTVIISFVLIIIVIPALNSSDLTRRVLLCCTVRGILYFLFFLSIVKIENQNLYLVSLIMPFITCILLVRLVLIVSGGIRVGVPSGERHTPNTWYCRTIEKILFQSPHGNRRPRDTRVRVGSKSISLNWGWINSGWIQTDRFGWRSTQNTRSIPIRNIIHTKVIDHRLIDWSCKKKKDCLMGRRSTRENDWLIRKVKQKLTDWERESEERARRGSFCRDGNGIRAPVFASRQTQYRYVIPPIYPLIIDNRRIILVRGDILIGGGDSIGGGILIGAGICVRSIAWRMKVWFISASPSNASLREEKGRSKSRSKTKINMKHIMRLIAASDWMRTVKTTSVHSEDTQWG